MTSELSIFAAQLREFISFQAEEPSFGQALTDDAIAQHAEAQFNGYAMLLFTLQFKANAPYRKFCEARGVKPDALNHWKEIPAVPTAAFKDFELTSIPVEQRTTVFHSSGTTEQRPSRHFHCPESLAVYEESLWPWFKRHVISDFGPRNSDFNVAILTPPPAQAPHSSLVHMFEVVRGKLKAPHESFVGFTNKENSWQINFDSVRSALNSAQREQKPLALIGTAFSFVHLLDGLQETKLDCKLPPGSRVMETGGYKGRSRSLPKPELHALISARLGVPLSHIVTEYGMSELSSQAYDHCISNEPTPAPSQEGNSSVAPRSTLRAPRSFRFPPWARVQIVSPETGGKVRDGETGLIRVFDLANVFSVMAVQTEDLAVRRGDGFELIGRAERAEPRGCSLMSA